MNPKLPTAKKNLQVARLTYKKIMNDLKEQLKEQQKSREPTKTRRMRLSREGSHFALEMVKTSKVIGF